MKKAFKEKFSAISLRFFNVYGPRSTAKSSYSSVISIFYKQKLKNKPLTVVGDGFQSRDFIYISDVIMAYKLVLQKSSLMERFVGFEVGTGKETSIKEMILQIKKFTKSTTTLNFGALDYRSNEIMKSKANIKALCDLGWKPQFTIEEGLKSMEGI